MTQIRLGLAQVRQTDSLADNSTAVLDAMDQAARQNVRILCFPETQTFGYRADISSATAPVPTAALDDLHARVARRCGELGMACVLGTEIAAENGRPYNSALVVRETGEIAGFHHKSKLTPLDAVAYEAGDSVQTWDLCGVKTGVVICFEGFRFPETTRECVRQGAQLVLHPQNNTTRPNDWKLPVHESMIVTRAAENTIWFASCNAYLPPHQNCRSMVVAPDGRITAQAELLREELVVADLDLDLATRAMFLGDLAGCAPALFGDTVAPREFASALATSAASGPPAGNPPAGG